MTLFADVVVPLPVERVFRYLVPERLRGAVRPGVRVLVPFGRRELTGFVVSLAEEPGPDGVSLKEISVVLDADPVFGPPFLAFSRDLARLSYVSWGEVLQSALPPSFLVRERTSVSLTPAGADVARKGGLGKRERELARLLGSRTYTPAHLSRKLRGVDVSGLLARMESKGLVQVRKSVGALEPRRRPRPQKPPADETQLVLDFRAGSVRGEAVDPVFQRLGAGGFASFLIRGPQAGRDALYVALLREVGARSGTAVVLHPEVASTRAFAERLETRLGGVAAVLHGEVPEARREREWRRVREGRVSVVCGTRAALLAPLARPLVFIVDDEHEESYLQERPAFDVRLGARLRAEAEGALLVMGSEVPTVESVHRARKGGWLVELPGEERPASVEVVDAGRDKGLISARLARALAGALAGGGQAVVFHNKRGYAASLVCVQCAFIPKCQRCEIPLVLHKRGGTLVCPLCGESKPAPIACPRCAGRFQARGAGIEAVEEALRRLFPDIPLASFDSDALIRRGDQDAVVRRFARGALKILVGTELLARRRDVPAVSLAAVLAPERILARPDFRAGQRAYQALHRMIRFCAGAEGGRALIQTALPDHFVIRSAAAGDYEAFCREETDFRRLLGYPPFSAMAEVVLEGGSLRGVGGEARRLAEALRRADSSVEVLGPALAAVPRVRGLFRVQIALRAADREAIDAILASSLPPGGGRLSVSVFS
ncbi:MAG: primosomal protein N' [Candidatus Aminicenantes bacterium]|nr:primosomal protein N' [Candidatus Aminicenantes bacterium]